MEAICEVRNLGVRFAAHPFPVIALEDVSLDLVPGRILGILGESGSGKSQLARAITRLTRGEVAGAVHHSGRELLAAREHVLRDVRGRRIAYVFQDPMTALNPYLRISAQLTEVARRHLGLTRRAAMARAREMLERVRLPDAGARLRSFPHELSGGMRQRVTIAMAMMARPDVLIADEPTTALDATVQVQVLDLLRELCDRDRLAMMVITHDISVLARIADDVLILYAGREAETGPAADVLTAPLHPYTRGLMDSTPDLERPPGEGIDGIHGTLPGPDAARGACLFHPRCPRAGARCAAERPEMRDLAPGRRAACHFPLEGTG